VEAKKVQITDEDLERMALEACAGGKAWNIDSVLRIFFQVLVDGRNWSYGEPDQTAVLVLPGQQDYRITRVLQNVWPAQGKYLWVAGTRGDPFIEEEDIVHRIVTTGQNSPCLDFIECQGWADNTPDQMEWACKMARKYAEVNHLIVATAAYHLPRCVLTFIKEMNKADLFVPVIPWPLTSFSGDSFAKKGNQNFALEIAKVLKYQESGHVAPVAEWEEYLKRRLGKDDTLKNAEK
jgi:hypothetical protein